MKTIICQMTLMILLVLGSVIPAQSTDGKPKTGNFTATEESIPPEVQTLLNRLEEINAMDKSNLTRTEKRELRAEVNAISDELHSHSHGVYLSFGAVIIIILLLILIF